MLIRFKFGNGFVRILNTENISQMCEVSSEIEFNPMLMVVKFSSQKQAIEALDKIYTAYADGARAVTIEVD